MTQGGERDIRVVAGGCRDRDGVDVVAGQQLVEVGGPGDPPPLAGRPGMLGRGARDGDQTGAVDGTHRLDVLGRDAAAADEAEADLGRGRHGWVRRVDGRIVAAVHRTSLGRSDRQVSGDALTGGAIPKVTALGQPPCRAVLGPGSSRRGRLAVGDLLHQPFAGVDDVAAHGRLERVGLPRRAPRRRVGACWRTTAGPSGA